MKSRTRHIFLFIILALAAISCSKPGDPSVPSVGSHDSYENLAIKDGRMDTGNHQLWSYNLITFDTTNIDNVQAALIPIRQTETHWNVVKFLEQSVCIDCLKITNITPSGSGTILVDIEITHPFANPNFTGFDVRGIAIFNASDEFPTFGLTYSNPDLGDGALVNAEGYTALYNASTLGSGPAGLQGYLKGKFATATMPDAELNGFIRHISGGSENTRNALYAGDSVTATYEIDMPDGGPFVMGYAVDAGWTPADNIPVVDPIVDFPISANAPEPWDILATVNDGLTDQGGSAFVNATVYDFEGKDSHNQIRCESPDLYNGIGSSAWTGGGDGFNKYKTTISNYNLAPAGEYDVLVCVEPVQYDPDNAPWLDIRTFQIVKAEVIEAPVLPTILTPDSLNTTGNYIKISGNYAYTSGEYYGVNIFDISDPENPAWISKIRTTNWQEGGLGLKDHYLYIPNQPGANTLSVIDVADPYNPVIVAEVPNSGFNENITVDGDIAYICNGTTGFTLFDISEPESPVSITTVDTEGRTLDTDVSGGFAYIADEANGLVIMDVDPPEETSIVTTVPVDDEANGVIYNDGYVYVFDYKVGVQVVDVDPVESASIVHTVPTANGGYLKTAWDGEIVGNTIFIAHGEKFSVVDITDPLTATEIGTLEYPGDYTTDIAISGNYALLPDWDSGFKAIDISDPSMPTIAGYEYSPGSSTDIAVSGNFAFAGNGWSVPMILDITDPASAYVLFVPNGFPSTFQVAPYLDEYMVGTRSSDGIYIADINPPSMTFLADEIPGFYAFDIDIEGDYAYLASGPNGISVVNLTDPNNIFIEATAPLTSSNAIGVAYSNGYAYLACDSGGIDIYDVDPVASTSMVNHVDTETNAQSVALMSNYAFVSANQNIYVLDITDPTTAAIDYTIVTVDGYARESVVNNGILYVANDAGIEMHDIDPIEDIQFMGSMDLPGRSFTITLDGNLVYLTGDRYPGGVQILELP
jgi:hypothetical protein